MRWQIGQMASKLRSLETGFEEMGSFLSHSVYHRDHGQLNIPVG